MLNNRIAGKTFDSFTKWMIPVHKGIFVIFDKAGNFHDCNLLYGLMKSYTFRIKQ